jgi:hypothetical protein
MPTAGSTISRSRRITREFATHGGAKPVVPKTLENIAPKAPTAAVQPAAASASVVAAWTPSEESRKALVAAGRSTVPKPVMRIAAAVAAAAAPTAPRVQRAVYARDDAATLALALVLGCAEYVRAAPRGKLLVVTPDGDAAQADGIKLKLEALFPSVTVASADNVTSATAASVVVGSADAVRTALKSELASFNVVVFLLASTATLSARQSAEKLDALRALAAHAAFGATNGPRAVVVGPYIRAVTNLTLSTTSAVPDEGAAVSADAAPSKAPAALRDVEMKYFVVQGIAKYHLLHNIATASNLSKLGMNKILVRFATKEIASFYCDALLAANVNATIFCDVETDAALDDDEEVGGSMDVPRAGVAPTHVLQDVVKKFESSPTGCVLLSAYGLSSPHANIILEFDPPADLAAYVTSVMAADSADAAAKSHIMMLDPAAHTHVVATMKHHANVLSSAVRPKKAARTETTATPGSNDAAVPQWRFKRLPNPTASDLVIAGNQLRNLGKKIFTINNKGYHAFKSYMHYYALLRPQSVFDVYKLDFEQTAKQFGLDEAPLLDIRTRSNQFRPKEDYTKFAAQRQKQQRREDRRNADENIQPEAPADE